MPSGGTMKHENRGADFLVCPGRLESLPHTVYFQGRRDIDANLGSSFQLVDPVRRMNHDRYF
jgi:hypothetical protein